MVPQDVTLLDQISPRVQLLTSLSSRWKKDMALYGETIGSVEITRSNCGEKNATVDTPMSPPTEQKGPSYTPYPVDIQGSNTQQFLETITNHFQRMGLDANSPLANYSDCVICGKSTMQIQQRSSYGLPM